MTADLHTARLADPARLEALAATGLADSEPEEAFDRLTGLVQRCLRVPVALVSIVDDHRQVFKSQQGLPEPWCSIRETPLSHSFCKHVVVQDAPLVIEDARVEPLVQDNPAVLEFNVAAYLGVPLRTPDGHTLGSLCAIDSVPRAWTEADREVVEALAEAVMVEIATRCRLEARADGIGFSLGLIDALFRALFEGGHQLTAVLRSDGRVAEANRALLAFVGLVPGAAVGQEIWTLLPLDEAVESRLREAVARASAGEAVVEAGAVPDGAGGVRDLRLGVRPVPGAGGLLLFEGRDAA